MVFRFDGFDISAILFSNVFPSAPNSQAILLKGKKPDAEMEKIIFAIILQEEENGFSIWNGRSDHWRGMTICHGELSLGDERDIHHAGKHSSRSLQGELYLHSRTEHA